MHTPAIIFNNDQLTIIDQTLLPQQLKYLAISSVDQCVEAIKHLRVRGAPAIGICAAYAISLAANQLSDKNYVTFKKSMDKSCQILYQSRPTAVNLGWAIKRMQIVYHSNRHLPLVKIITLLKSEAIKIHLEDKEACHQIGYNGLAVVPNPANILTHCNTGSLATGGWGTALGIIYAARQQNYNIHVYVDETRPIGQGARLTFWELMHNDVPCTLITDSAAGSLMKDEKIDLVLFGADRITKNGDVANKIGSYSLAVLARFHGIPCYAVAPSSTFDFSLKSGDEIEIELRNSQEILHIYRYNDNLLDIADVYNPAFDITPSDFLSGIITEKGIINKPIKKQISEIFNINT
jgi:methylthioribose-1-phosphate isomerase